MNIIILLLEFTLPVKIKMKLPGWGEKWDWAISGTKCKKTHQYDTNVDYTHSCYDFPAGTYDLVCKSNKDCNVAKKGWNEGHDLLNNNTDNLSYIEINGKKYCLGSQDSNNLGWPIECGDYKCNQCEYSEKITLGIFLFICF